MSIQPNQLSRAMERGIDTGGVTSLKRPELVGFDAYNYCHGCVSQTHHCPWVKKSNTARHKPRPNSKPQSSTTSLCVRTAESQYSPFPLSSQSEPL
eukprot:629759-Amphidinium_carterae.1